MKVSKGSVSSSYRSSAASSAYGKTKRVESTQNMDDSFEVSESAGLFQKAAVAIKDVPDVRTEAVEPLRNEVASGDYQRDDRDVAERVLQDYLSP